jgi:NADH-quinone oxidoreductase subunit M
MFALASLGLPGLGDFVGEFLVLVGTWGEHPILATAGAVGVLAATFYALYMVQRAFYGPNTRNWAIPDLGSRERAMVALMAGSLLWLGLDPQPVLNTFHPALKACLTTVLGRK